MTYAKLVDILDRLCAPTGWDWECHAEREGLVVFRGSGGKVVGRYFFGRAFINRLA